MAVGDNSVDVSLEKLRNKPEQIIFSLELKKEEKKVFLSVQYVTQCVSCSLYISLRERGADCVGSGFEPVNLTPPHFQCQRCTCKEARTFPRGRVSLSLAGLPATFMSGSTSISPVLQPSLLHIFSSLAHKNHKGYKGDFWSINLPQRFRIKLRGRTVVWQASGHHNSRTKLF